MEYKSPVEPYANRTIRLPCLILFDHTIAFILLNQPINKSSTAISSRILICLLSLFAFAAHDSIAQKAKLMLPIGHTGPVQYAAFSPDGKRVVTASHDKTAKIWDAISGNLLANLTGHSDFVFTALYSHDGAKIVTASFDGLAKVWDANSGEWLFDLKAHTDMVWSAEFSKDGKKIITASNDNTAKVWDAANGKLLSDLKAHTGAIQTASFSPEGKKAVTGSYDSTVRIWDVTTGEVLIVLKASGSFYSAQFSPDGRSVVTASADRSAIVWNVLSGKKVLELKGHRDEVWMASFSPDGKEIVTASLDSSAMIWDANTGKLIVELKGHEAALWYVKFSPDGKKLLTASADRTAKIWDVVTGRQVASIVHNGEVWSGFFSGDGQRFVTASNDKTAKIWETSTGKLLKDLKGYTSGLWSVKPSPDPGRMLTVSGDHIVRIWDIKEGKVLQELKGHTDSVYAAVYSPDGKSIVTISKDTTAKIWDAESGMLLHELKKHTDRLTAVQFSPDGNKIATASDDKTIKIWDAMDGVFLRECVGHTAAIATLRFRFDSKYLVSAARDSTAKIWGTETGHLVTDLKGYQSRVVFAEFNPDGSKVVTGGFDSTAIVWEARTGNRIADLKGHADVISSAKFSPDGKKIVTASYDHTAKIWDAVTGHLLNSLTGHSFYLRTAEFTKDGTRVITSSRDNSARIWDAATGKLVADLSGEPGEVESSALTSDGSNILTAAARTTVSIWDAKAAQRFYTLFTVGESGYLIVDKDGRFDGTEAARKLLYFTCGTEVISLEQVKDRLWLPNLANRLMQKDSINVTKLSDLDICAFTPKVGLKRNGQLFYEFKITPRRGALGETVLSLNGIEIKRYRPSQLRRVGPDYILSVRKDELNNFYVSGENTVAVKAWVAGNDISSETAAVVETIQVNDAKSPNLYGVMIGVGDYKGDELDLKYAAKDAVDISNAVALSASKLLDKSHVFMYNLATGGRQGRFPEKKTIKQVFEEIGKKSTAKDILLVFFAGHGVVKGEKKQFYFLTADALSSSLTLPGMKEAGIGAEELMEWIKPANIKAQKRVLIFDACHSGSAINEMLKAGREEGYLAVRNEEPAAIIKQIDRLNEKAGLYVLAASASNQGAYEMGKYNQGLLTYCLLKAIKEHPEVLEEGRYLNVSGWFNKTQNILSAIVRENRLRQEPQLVTTTNFNIGVVDAEVLSKIVLPYEKPLFAGSNFQNNDEAIADDDLELSSYVNQQLSYVASFEREADINFVSATTSPLAWRLTGRYSVLGENVSVKINIKRVRVMDRFEIVGTKTNLRGLADEIVNAAIQRVRRMNSSVRK